MQPVAFIPSPSQGVWHLGFVPIRAYALMIIIGIVVAVWLGERRWAAKGGQPGVVIDIAVWAVPFGLVGGRLYHVLTDAQRYFGEGRDPIDALKIWEGGLGIWGAVLFGAVGAVIGCRRHGISVAALGDAVAPGIVLAQGIGRWGNYWNQELYGRPLDTFWALEIDQTHRPRLEDGSLDPRYADIATYHPTFLYESLWCVGVAVLVIWAERRYKLTHGRAFALYLAGYTVGRFWIEWLRIDEAHHILGLRLNDWTALIVFLGAVGYMYWARDKTGPEKVGAPPETEPAGGAGAAVPEGEAKPDETPKGEGTPQDAPETLESDAEKAEGAEKAENESVAGDGKDDPEDPAKPEASTEESVAEPEPEPASEPVSEPVSEPESAPEPAASQEDADESKAPEGGPEDDAAPGAGENEAKGEPVKDRK
jgi:prolipoprotein diacylglyceryl transferase